MKVVGREKSIITKEKYEVDEEKIGGDGEDDEDNNNDNNDDDNDGDSDA